QTSGDGGGGRGFKHDRDLIELGRPLGRVKLDSVGQVREMHGELRVQVTALGGEQGGVTVAARDRDVLAALCVIAGDLGDLQNHAGLHGSHLDAVNVVGRASLQVIPDQNRILVVFIGFEVGHAGGASGVVVFHHG